MGRLRSFVITLATAGVAAAAAAQQPPAGAPPDRAAQERAAAELNARPDTPGTGQFPAMKEEVPSLPRHVVYRPKALDGLGRQKLGVVAWGNGGCSDWGKGGSTTRPWGGARSGCRRGSHSGMSA